MNTPPTSTTPSGVFDSPAPSTPSTSKPGLFDSTTTSLRGSGTTSPTLGDKYADIEAGEPALAYAAGPDAGRIQLPSDELDSAYDPHNPWPRLGARLARLPGVPPLLRITNRVLGPSHRTPPPIPSAPLTLSFTAGSRNRSFNPDGGFARLSRRLHLRYWWLPFLACWAALNIGLIKAAYYLPSSPEMIGCTATMWPDWPPDTCGVNGTACVSNLTPGVYRCPGGCANTNLGNPRWIGASKISGRPLVVGGGDERGVYR